MIFAARFKTVLVGSHDTNAGKRSIGLRPPLLEFRCITLGKALLLRFIFNGARWSFYGLPDQTRIIAGKNVNMLKFLGGL